MKKSVLSLVILMSVLGTQTMSAQHRNGGMDRRGNQPRQEMRGNDRQRMDNRNGNGRGDYRNDDNRHGGFRYDDHGRMEYRPGGCVPGHVVPVRHEPHVIYVDPRPVPPPPPVHERVVVYENPSPGSVIAGAVAVGVLTALLGH